MKLKLFVYYNSFGLAFSPDRVCENINDSVVVTFTQNDIDLLTDEGLIENADEYELIAALSRYCEPLLDNSIEMSWYDGVRERSTIIEGKWG